MNITLFNFLYDIFNIFKAAFKSFKNIVCNDLILRILRALL